MKTKLFRRYHTLFGSVAVAGLVESGRVLWTLTAMVIPAILLAGCAYNRPLFSEQVVTTNGIITTRSLSVRTFALWPATTQLEKQRASLGKTMSLGTTGLSEDSGGTNIAATIEALTKLLQTIK